MRDKLENWRKQIDILDQKILILFTKRMKIVEEIGKFKKSQGIAPLDEKRWRQVLESKLAKAKVLNLSKSFIKKLYDLVHKYSLEIEKQK